jgi:DNA polymerase III epsilon subunit-like protein
MSELNLTHRITFFDVETGGLDPNHHPIIQIAAVRVNHTFTKWYSFECKIQFDTQAADPQALAMNSYDAAVWQTEAVPPRDAIERFAAFLNEGADIEKVSRRGKPYFVAQLAAHNAQFDRDFVWRLFKEHDVFLPASWHVIDTLQLALAAQALGHHNAPSLKLSDLCAAYGIELTNAHDALGDVQATALLARKLLAAFA